MARDSLDFILPLGLAAGVGFVAWKLLAKKDGAAPAPAPSSSLPPAGSGVLLPEYQPQPSWPSNLNIDWSNIGGSIVAPSAAGGGGSSSPSSSVETPLGPVTPPSWYPGSGVLMGYGAYGAASDPRPVAWMQLAEMVSVAQGQVDRAWAEYSSSLLNRLCAGAGLCPAYQNTADMVTSTDALAASLVSLAQELSNNPDATYDNGQKKRDVFESTASNFVGNVSSIVAQLGENSWTAALRDFVMRFPQSLRDVLSWTVDTAGNVVQQAGWSIAKTALILGGTAALIFWLVSKSGAKLDLGPLKI